MTFLSVSSLPFQQATATQRVQLLHYLRVRLQSHFPTLTERPFVRTLAEVRPVLLLTGTQVTLTYPELTQLVQYLGNATELPLLDPPFYGPHALELAQYILHTSELAVAALYELTNMLNARCGFHLWELLQRLARPYALAEQVVQAQRWDLPGSPRLPPGIPGGGPAPGSQVVEELLQRLRSFTDQPTGKEK
jgi:hypothetical protein